MKNMILQKKKFIMCIYENNFYGLGMSQYFPICEFKSLKNIDKLDIKAVSENSSIVYVLEVHLEYLDELHYLHNNYLLPLEILTIFYHTLSNYRKNIAHKLGIKLSNVKKLVSNLDNKTN